MTVTETRCSRLRGYMKELDYLEYVEFGTKMQPEAAAGQANLVSSETDVAGFHMPAIDVDLPCQLVESSTPGHFHLYIDVPIPWERYRKLLKALYKAGIVERGYYQASVARGASYLRLPGVKKVKF